jgi:hypothetical protein
MKRHHRHNLPEINEFIKSMTLVAAPRRLSGKRVKKWPSSPQTPFLLIPLAELVDVMPSAFDSVAQRGNLFGQLSLSSIQPTVWCK